MRLYFNEKSHSWKQIVSAPPLLPPPPPRCCSPLTALLRGNPSKPPPEPSSLVPGGFRVSVRADGLCLRCPIGPIPPLTLTSPSLPPSPEHHVLIADNCYFFFSRGVGAATAAFLRWKSP